MLVIVVSSIEMVWWWWWWWWRSVEVAVALSMQVVGWRVVVMVAVACLCRWWWRSAVVVIIASLTEGVG